MLVLSRKPNQKVLLPEINATIEVLEVRGNSVKLGINAPDQVEVIREELISNMTEFGKLLNSAAKKECSERKLINKFSLGLSLLSKQIQLGASLAEVRTTIKRLQAELYTNNPQTVTSSRLHTLLVEDDPTERELLASILQLAGIEVIAKADGIDALDYLHREPQKPDVILLSIAPSDMEGQQIITNIRTIPELTQAKIFVITADEEKPDKNLPVDYWLRKPIDPDALINKVHRLTA